MKSDISSNAPFPVDEDRWLKIRGKTGIAVIGLVIVATGYCLSLKFDVSRHTEQLKDVAEQQALLNRKLESDHDLLLDFKAVQREQTIVLKYLADGRRGPAPQVSVP